MPSLKLYEFPVSHYCEKIRWALDYKQLKYTRVCMVPLLHVPRMLMLTRQTQVPMLEMGKLRITDSPRILAKLEEYFIERPTLLPEDNEYCRKALELCTDFDKNIGIHLRRLSYSHILHHQPSVLELFSAEQSPLRRKVLQFSLPAIIQTMRKGLGINPANYTKSLDKFNQAVDRLDEHIQSNGYLVGNEFSIADLTAAALLSPLVRPAGTIYADLQHATEEFLAFCDGYSKRPFFGWVQTIYQKHR